MDRKIRADIIKELNVIYSKAHNDATALRKNYNPSRRENPFALMMG
ncbi:MAG: hypothetical protein PUD27_01270 [Solobacterium sp.]|nr:hypothetical protein [Solobacterium sp.]